MGFHFFPPKMNSVKASKHEKHLKLVRVVSLAALIVDLILVFVLNSFDIMGMGAWAIIYALVFEVLAVSTYFLEKIDVLDKIATIVYLVAWSFSVIVVIVLLFVYFLKILLLSSPLYTPSFSLTDFLFFVPFGVLCADYLYNKISYIRIHYVFPLGLLILDLLLWYNNFETFELVLSTWNMIVLKLVFVLLAFGVLEVSRVIKVKSCKEDDVEQSLL